jgi:hypothetical protein
MMDKRFGYNVKVLVDKLFPCHVFKTIVTEHEGEEFYKEEHSSYIAYPELIRVKFWHGCFSTSQTLYSEDGEESHAISKNVNTDDKSVQRINQMSHISPELKMIGDTYCEVSDELNAWIYQYAVVDRLTDGETLDGVLSAISKVFNVDYEAEFKGCPSPVYSQFSDSWAACTTTNLTMLGTEIETVLQDIRDVSMRKKVEFIFKHYGKKRYNK